MAYPSVTYSTTSGYTADANRLNTNFNNIVEGMSDGTKAFNVNTVTFNGNVSVIGTTVISGDLLSYGRESGFRTVLQFDSRIGISSSSSGKYLFTTHAEGGIDSSLPSACIMPRSGSIRAVSFRIERITGAGGGNATLTHIIRQNGSTMIAGLGSFTLNASSVTSYNASFVRGLYEFSSGDKIGFSPSFSVYPGGSSSFYFTQLLEVQYN